MFRYCRLYALWCLVASSLLFPLVITGCGTEIVKESSADSELRLQAFAVKRLPKDVKNIQEYGNGWYSFELELYGKRRQFLFHLAGVRDDLEYDSARECLTELSP